jgi:thymidylate synthase
MNSIDTQYKQLLKDILDFGSDKSDRTGVGTRSIFGYTIRHNMQDGFPLLTTKKMYWKGIVTELLWFLRGDTNIKFLVDNDCHIWDGDAYKAYQNHFVGHEDIPSKDWFIHEIKTNDEFAKKWGELGPVYGKQWKNWKTFFTQKQGIDQIQNLINDLKTNPDSRRLMVSAWNVGELNEMVLPPCHYGFQVYTRELTWEEQVQWVMKNTNVELENFYIVEEIAKDSTPKRAISLMWNQRSVDTFLGLPFNIASYGLLLEIIAKAVNMVPDQLIGNLGDVHLYNNHFEAANEVIGRPYDHTEREAMLKAAMGTEDYEYAISQLAPFGGGMGLHYDHHKIPKTTREPYTLPKLVINTEFWPTESGECGVGPLHSNIDTLINNMQIDDFQIVGYQSHSAVKAKLNN